MDPITLPARFIPDGASMPDLTDFRDPIVLAARWEAEPPAAPDEDSN